MIFKLTGVSLINAVDFPSRNRLRMIISPSASMPFSSSICQMGCCSSGVKMAVTSAVGLSAPINPKLARLPRASPRASSRMDLPAPVSPVRTVKPDWNSRSSVLMRTTLRTASKVSINQNQEVARPKRDCRTDGS